MSTYGKMLEDYIIDTTTWNQCMCCFDTDNKANYDTLNTFEGKCAHICEECHREYSPILSTSIYKGTDITVEADNLEALFKKRVHNIEKYNCKRSRK